MVGEHIRARKGGSWNHAIDCGDETVIHLAGDSSGTSRVLRSYRPEFVAGAEVVEVVTHRERTFPPDEVVARAYSRIAEPALAAMFRDSEAFADWCATGRLPAGPRDVAVSAPIPAAAPPEAARAAPGAARAAARPRAPSRRTPARKAKVKARPAAKRKGSTRALRKAKPAETSRPRARKKKGRR